MAVSLQGRAFKPVEAELFGHEFQTVSLTRSKAKVFAELAGKLEEIEGGEADKLDGAVEVIGEMLDVLLTPTDSKKAKPSKIVADKWKADEITLDDLLGFVGDLQAQRPT